MTWIPVVPKVQFLEWTGSNLDEWRERWANAEITEGGRLSYGPGIIAAVGDGMVEGGGISIWLITAADFAAQFNLGSGDG